jgi:dihydropteroate synthase
VVTSHELAGPDGFPTFDRAVVMGVLNVTPDSFSDGGRYADTTAAVEHGLALAAEGADIIDVGGESTRPGAQRVDPEVELARVIPVVRELADAGLRVSIDTMRAAVAEAAIDAGAVLVNDVSGGLADVDMLKVIAATQAPYVVMHSRGASADMQQRAAYDDVVAEVTAELAARLHAVVDAGVNVQRVVLDPGIGFAKTAEHNWALLSRLDALTALGRPLLVGVSRKSFLGTLLADADGTPRPVDDREDATAALSGILAVEGVWGIRVHAVQPTADAVRVAAAMRAERVGLLS